MLYYPPIESEETMHALTQIPARVTPPRHEPLAQVELLLLFHPSLQLGGAKRVAAEACARASQGWLTLDVYGSRGMSEITGRPIMKMDWGSSLDLIYFEQSKKLRWCR